MAKNEKLVKCPNYSVCGTMVGESKAGQEHRFGMWDAEKQRMVYVTCNGG